MNSFYRIFLFSVILLPTLLKAGANDDFINEKQLTFDKWAKNLSFLDGHIYLENDTQFVEILEFVKAKKKYYNVFCVVRYSDDSISFLSSKNIKGFKIKDIYYQSNYLMDESFFMQKVSSGKIDLYVKEGIPSDNRYLFFLKHAGNFIYYLLDPIESNILYLKANSAGNQNYALDVNKKKLTESFKKFVNMQMGDCSEIRNLVNSEFYKMEDLKYLVDKYNVWNTQNNLPK